MSTATIAFVRGVTAASTAAGSRVSVRGSTSANTGVAPSYMTQFADATKENGDVIASSPGPSPASRAQRWRPAVPLETAAAWRAPTRSANASSKRAIIGPSDRRPERSTSRRSSSSRSSTNGARAGSRRHGSAVPRPPALARSRLRGRRVLVYSSQCAHARVAPGRVSRYARWISVVTGPGSPISTSSIARIGVTSAAVPHHEDLVAA